MRIFLSFLLVWASLNAIGQNRTYGVYLNDTKVGSYSEYEEYGTYVTTFTKLKVEFAQGLDTVRFSQESIWTQDTLGNLLAVRTEKITADTLEEYKQFPIDTTSIDSLRKVVLGPYGIRLMAKENLKKEGDIWHFHTYLPDLGFVSKNTWTYSGHSIEKGEKLRIIKEEVLNRTKCESKRNKKFNLIESTASFPLGDLKIKSQPAVNTEIPYLAKLGYKSFLPSNTYLPDPQNLNAISLEISVGDSTRELHLTDNSFEPIPNDTTLIKEYLEFNQWVQPLDSALVSIAFPIAINRMAPVGKMHRLTQIIDSMSIRPMEKNLTLLRIARYLDLPSCLSFGLVYHQGGWMPHTCVKVGIDEEWIAFDPVWNEPVSTALRIPFGFSSLSNGYIDFLPPSQEYFDSLEINTTQLLLNKRPIKPKGKTGSFVEIKHDRYINHALGVSFDIPDGFAMDTLNRTKPSPVFVSLSSDTDDNIELVQVTDIDREKKETLKKYMSLWTQSTDEVKQETPNLYTSYGTDRAILGAIMGNSFIVIKITSTQSEELTRFFLKKNLEFGY